MRETRVASRYAKSLLVLADEKKTLDQARDDMQLVADTCQSSKELSLLLKSPIIKADKKTAILHKIFGKRIGELALSFIDIITRKGREKHLEQIAQEFIAQYKIHKNITTAVVTSAIPLDKALKEKVLALVQEKSGNKIDLVEQVDGAIIGGFVIRIGDWQLDASVKLQLHDLSMEFSKNPYIKDF